MKGLLLISMLMTLSLAGCTTLQSLQTRSFTDPASNFHLQWGPQFTKVAAAPGYLLRQSWRQDMRPEEPGALVGSWVLQGSNDVTAAVLRYGVSRDRRSVKNCLIPAGGRANIPTNQVMIGGRPFTHYRLHDAGMSHYLQADVYRSRYQGNCFAIDLIVHGTNPEVYDPPRTQPFSGDAAREALHALLLKINWLAPEP